MGIWLQGSFKAQRSTETLTIYLNIVVGFCSCEEMKAFNLAERSCFTHKWLSELKCNVNGHEVQQF